MKIIFLGTGPAKPTKDRTNSSVLIGNILIDCTPMFLEQIKRENIKPEDIKFALITHAHKDAIGGLGDLDKWINHEVLTLVPRDVNINRFIKSFKNLKISSMKNGTEYDLNGDYLVTPFRVIHYEFHPTLGKKFPTYGYRINDLVYAEDMEFIPKASAKYFKNANTIIADGAMWFDTQIRGHLSVDKTLLLAKRFEPKHLIIIQAGRTYPSQEQAEQELKEYWNQIKENTKTLIHLAYDGMKFDTEVLEEELQAFGSPGGKSRIAKKLIQLIPKHKTYVEPFAGGAAVYWQKEPSEMEVINDLDSEIAFAYNFIKNITSEQIEQLKHKDWKPNKKLFFQIRDNKISSNPIDRFYNYMYLVRNSYGITRDTFGYFRVKSKMPAFNRYERFKQRLSNTKVYNLDYSKIIEKFDSEDTFFYIDPPYPAEWHFQGMAWDKGNMIKLKNLLKTVKGKWLLSINNFLWIRELFSEFNIQKILVPRTLSKGDKPKYELLISNYETKELALEFPGIYLIKPHAEMIWKGDKKLIIKSILYKNMIDKPLYYLDKNYSYGILKLKKPELINLKKFNELKETHKITDDEREKWWKNKEAFYAYGFDIIDTFETPKPVSIPKGIQTFIEDVKFMQETGTPSIRGDPIDGFGLQPIWIWGKRKKGIRLPTSEIIKLIEDVKQYDPTKPSNEQLADDWRIVNDWFATYQKTEGKGIKFSKETIINLAKIIYDEIIKRVKEGKIKHEFQPENMKPSSLELYRIVSGKSVIMTNWEELEFLNDLDDFNIIKDCISLIGSSVTQEHKPNDIDILIKMNDPNEFMKRAVEVRLAKMLPNELQGKLHFVWGEKEGPHDSFIPLFDLQFKRIIPVKMVTMIEDKSSKVQLMKPYLPQKPAGSAYYDLNKFLEAL